MFQKGPTWAVLEEAGMRRQDRMGVAVFQWEK